jgi:curved DNA-binding protein CbpA
MTSIITWYDVLGVLPDAELADIRAASQARMAALGPGTLAGAPPEVLTAADRARQSVQEALRVLADPAARESYDEQVGFARPGEGLIAPDRGPVGPEVGPGERSPAADGEAPKPHSHHAHAHRDEVPNVTGLFYRACTEVAGRLGLHIAPVRLTPRPMPVEGFVVGQDPAPGEQFRHDRTLTVKLWHPPEP